MGEEAEEEVVQLTNDEFEGVADELRKKAATISHPLLPASIKETIQGAAVLVGELVNRVRDLERRLDHAESNR